MSDAQTEREIRAARNQATFRAVNEKMTELNDSFAALTGTYTIACECADMSCVATLELTPEQYERRSGANRSASRSFPATSTRKWSE